MKRIAFIPVRGGSKSIPLKNIKVIAGRPLLHWSLQACEDCPEIDEIIVATDSDEIAMVAEEFQGSKVRIYRRQAANAQDKSSTESVLLEYLTQAQLHPKDIFILVQATNPFIRAQDLSRALRQIKRDKSQSLLSAVVNKRFFWKGSGRPINYDFKKRPRRQDFEGWMMENGAFYISSVGAVVKSKNRLSGKISVFEMPEYSGYEIDEPEDWIVVESLLERHHQREKDFSRVKLFLTDVDGVLTDAGMYYSQDGDAMKKFNTLDGMGLQLLQKQGIKVGIVTGETTQIVAKRSEKLGIDVLKQGIKDKLPVVKQIAAEFGCQLSEVAYIGDDINCLEVLKAVAYPACPLNAIPEVKKVPGILRLQKSGGEGVVRDFCEIILRSRKQKR